MNNKRSINIRKILLQFDCTECFYNSHMFKYMYDDAFGVIDVDRITNMKIAQSFVVLCRYISRCMYNDMK